MHKTSVGLVTGEGVSIGIWSRYTTDDEWDASVEGIARRVERIEEVVGLTSIYDL